VAINPANRIGILSNIGARLGGMTRVMTLGLALSSLAPALAGCDNKFPAVTYKFTPDQKAAFEKDYPFIVNAVMDNNRLQSLGLTYGMIKGADGWKVLSKSIYGTDQFAELIQDLNGNAPAPSAISNAVSNAFCGISDSYCAPVIKLRARSMSYTPTPASKAPAEDTSKPVNNGKPINPPVSVSGSASAGKIESKLTVSSLAPSKARAGGETPVTIRLKGESEKQGAVDVTASDSGITPVDISWKGPNLIGFTANLYYAKPGKYSISVTIDGVAVGSASFEVLPEKSE